jgi:hypothetical protein
MRYIENHDEQRVINILGENPSKAAAVIVLTLPGASLIHEGQMEGNEIKLPVQLGKNPIEDENAELSKFYNLLIQTIAKEDFDEAQWQLSKVAPVGVGDRSYSNIIAYDWRVNNDLTLIIVNYSIHNSKAHIIIKDFDYGNSQWIFEDIINQKEFRHNGNDLNEYGLYIELEQWESHIFRIKKA